MSDVTLNVTRTDTYTVEVTETDIRAAMDKENIGHEGLSLEEALEQLDGWSGELVLAALVGQTGADEETWALDDWSEDGDSE